jgi:hypothetical protein
MTDAIQPLWAHPEPGPRFKPSEAAALIMEPGMDAEKVAHEVRAWIRDGHVQTRERIGKGTKNPHAALSMSDVATAKVLSILKWDYGITDSQIVGFVSAGCYGWQDGDHTPREKQFPHPIFNAVNDASPANGRDWVFRLDAYREDDTGKRIFRTALYDMDAPPARRFDGAAPRGSLMLNLRPHLAPIMEAGWRKGQAN